MTREETIKGLNACIADVPDKCWENGDYPACPYNRNVDGCQLRMMKDVAELLKEQEPVEPKKKSFLISGVDEYYTSSLITVCGVCENWLSTAVPVPKYCPNCGRAVKWK